MIKKYIYILTNQNMKKQYFDTVKQKSEIVFKIKNPSVELPSFFNDNGCRYIRKLKYVKEISKLFDTFLIG